MNKMRMLVHHGSEKKEAATHEGVTLVDDSGNAYEVRPADKADGIEIRVMRANGIDRMIVYPMLSNQVRIL